MAFAFETDKYWVFDGLPAGMCEVRVRGRVLVPAVGVHAGEVSVVEPEMLGFGHLILKPVFRGKPATGPVRLVIRGAVGVYSTRVEVPADGELHLYPVPVGEVYIRVERSDMRSMRREPVAITGNGETEDVVLDLVRR